MTAAANLEGTLAPHAGRLSDRRLTDTLDADPARAVDFSLKVGPLYASFARQRYDRQALAALLELAGPAGAGLPAAFAALFDGSKVNASEDRPALHVALRSSLGGSVAATEAGSLARAARARMAALVAELAGSGVTDIVNVGVGGSDLGPRLVVDALKDFHDGRFRLHFVANMDGSEVQHALAGLDPRRTAAILVSKSFGTQETLLNGALLRDWIGDDARL